MFTDISWSSYITFMLIVCAVYYLIIGYSFYGSDLVQLISGVKHVQASNMSSHQANLTQAFENQEIFQLARSLADEIQAFLKEAGRKKLAKEAILQSLKLLIARYPAIKDSSFKEMVQNTIVKESGTNHSIHLSEQELSEVWG